MIQLENCYNIKTCIVNPRGWVSNLTVDYGFFHQPDEIVFLVWKIRYTDHCFNIQLRELTKRHNSDYVGHFEMVLSKIGDDIRQWVRDGLPEEWMKKYYNQFWNYLF